MALNEPRQMTLVALPSSTNAVISLQKAIKIFRHNLHLVMPSQLSQITLLVSMCLSIVSRRVCCTILPGEVRMTALQFPGIFLFFLFKNGGYLFPSAVTENLMTLSSLLKYDGLWLSHFTCQFPQEILLESHEFLHLQVPQVVSPTLGCSSYFQCLTLPSATQAVWLEMLLVGLKTKKVTEYLSFLCFSCNQGS